MRSAKAFFQRWPVLAYFVLTFVLSWGGWILIIGGAPLAADNWRSDPRVLIALLAAPLAPALAGVLLTGIVSGRAGYRLLGTRLLSWRVQARWYAAALLPAPLVAMTTGVLLALALGSSDFLPAAVTTQDTLGLLLRGIVTGLIVAVGEELGWTGYAMPRLRQRYRAVTTGLFVGVLWGAWHFPLFWESHSFTDGLSLSLLLVALFSWLPAYRILMVWVSDRTRSLFVPILMHASLSATQLVLLPADLSDTQSLISMLARSGAWWVIVAAVALATRHGRSQEPLRSMQAEPRVAEQA
jgi:membrane protease YdiL (CAAX protease family)